MEGAVLTGSTMEEAELKGANLRSAKLQKAAATQHSPPAECERL